MYIKRQGRAIETLDKGLFAVPAADLLARSI